MTWQHFSVDEFKCKCGCDQIAMDPYFMSRLEALRNALDFPFKISSGYRCSSHNYQLTGSRAGPHTHGRAVDVIVSGEQAFKLVQHAPSFQIQGIGVKQSGLLDKRFVHLDDLTVQDGFSRPRIWSY